MPFGSRYGDRHLEDDNFQPLGSRSDGRYFRTNREIRGSFSQKDWRSTSWEPAANTSGPGRLTASEVNNQKSVENSEACLNNSKVNDSPNPPPDSTSDQSLSHAKEQEKNGGTADGGGTSAQKSEKENGLESVDWKPLKWARSGSLPSRGPSFSNLSGTRSTGMDSVEVVSEVQQKSAMPVQSPPTPNIRSSVPASSDETICRKKPRLGWGEGLAKYEKKKVEGPEDGAVKDGVVLSVCITDNVHSPSVNLSDKSPRIASMSDCASPATPSSVAFSSSPGTEEKESIKPANVDQENNNFSGLPCDMSQKHYDGSTFNLESIDLASIAKLSNFLNELLQSEDASSAETDCVQITSMKKLLVWKVDILKALEVTESKIDALDTELKSLIAEPGSSSPCPDNSSLVPGECPLKPCTDLVAASASIVDHTFQVASTGRMNVENMPATVEESEALKTEEVNSPGSAMYKIIEPTGEDVCASGTAECEGFVKLDLKNSSNLNLLCSEDGLSDEINSCQLDVAESISDTCQKGNAGNVQCRGDSNYDTILASNKESASRALEELNKLLPSGNCFLDLSTASIMPPSRRSSLVKDKFLMRKQTLKFKEKVITLKFRVFQHFWREGRMVSVRKLRGKSDKMLDITHSGHKKNRSSSRSRIPYFASNHRTVPVEEVIKYINGLLSESSFKPCRNTLKMPALILDKDVKMSRFISNNGLVEDPCSVEKERSIINPWTAEETEIFIDKLAVFGKDFSKIASFLEHKTIADCIEFYYKNQKSECFARARKKPEFSEQRKSQATTYLVAAGKRWNREANAASLNVLGEASRGNSGMFQRSNSQEIYSNETVAADVLAGICGSLSSEAMNSCITSSFDHADGYQDWKYPRVNSGSRRPLTPDCTQNVDDEYSDESFEEMDSADWTDDEKSIFVQAVSSHGKDFDMIAQIVRTKSKEQCKIFFSKARKCLGLDQIHHGAGNAVSNNANGGGSDVEDGCVVQAGSTVCNGGSDCKMEKDLPPPDNKEKHESAAAAIQDLKPDVASVVADPVLENSSVVVTLLDKKHAVDSGTASKGKSDCACGSEVEGPTLVLSSHTESLLVEMGSGSVVAAGTKEAAEEEAPPDSAGSCCGENEGKGPPLPDYSFDAKKLEGDGKSSEITALSCAMTEVKSDLQLSGHVSPVGAFSSMQVGSGGHNLSDLQAAKSCVISSPEKDQMTTMESSSMMFSVPVKYQMLPNSKSLAYVGVGRISEKRSLEAVGVRDHQQNLPGYLSEAVDSPQILRGYPVSGQSLNEINGDVNCKNLPERDLNLHSNKHADFPLQKCTRRLNETASYQTPFQSYGKSNNENSRPPLSCPSDLDKPTRNGDVKLFGKVLISSQQKTNSCVQEAGCDEVEHHKASCQSLSLRYNSDHKSTFDSSVCGNKFIGSENTPVRSYGFPDGNNTHPFPSMPDSTLLLAKYPAAFGINPKPSGKLEFPSLQGVRSSESPVNCVTAFQRSRDLHYPTKEMKQQPQDIFSEMPRRNGFDPVQEIQHEPRMIGIGVGRAGMVVGGQCPGVSDPVAAIKMQYAKAQNISVPASNTHIEENDSWKSNGNVGR